MELADDSALELVRGKLIVTTPELIRVQLEWGQKNQLMDRNVTPYDSVFNLYGHLVRQGLGKSMVVAPLGGGRGIRRITDSGYVKQWDLQDIAAIWRENDDSLWAGSRARLYHLTSPGVAQWPLPAGLPASRCTA